MKLLTLFLLTGMAMSAKAQLLTFGPPSPGFGMHIPNGYGGLDWTNFWMEDRAFVVGTGYDHGTVSLPGFAYNGFGMPASLGSKDSFNFTSLYLTAAFYDGLSVKISGLFDSTVLYSNTFVVNTEGPTFELLNYVGVNNVTFESFGGTLHPGAIGDGPEFVLDNVQLNGTSAVPEPATFGVLGSFGLGLLVVARRRKA